jgi:hypothetical protein
LGDPLGGPWTLRPGHPARVTATACGWLIVGLDGRPLEVVALADVMAG